MRNKKLIITRKGKNKPVKAKYGTVSGLIKTDKSAMISRTAKSQFRNTPDLKRSFFKIKIYYTAILK